MLHLSPLLRLDSRVWAVYRAGPLIAVPVCRLESYRKSFFPDCARLWNSLDLNMRTSQSKHMFKLNMIDYISVPHPPLFLRWKAYSLFCLGRLGAIVTLFRLGLSPLRADLFKAKLFD